MSDGQAAETNSKRNITFGSIVGYLAFFINIVFGLFFTPWAASILGKNYGIYTIALSLISMFLVDFGLSTTTTVFLSKFRANNDEKSVQGFLNSTFKIYMILDFLLAIIFTIVFFCIPYMYSDPAQWGQDRIISLQISFLIVAVFSLISFPGTMLTGIISSYEKFTFLKTVDLISKVAYVVLTSITLVVLPVIGLSSYCLYGLVVSNCVGGLISLLCKAVFIRKRLHINLSIFKKTDKEESLKIVSYSIYSAIIGIGTRFIFTICPIILGITAGPLASGTFGFISTIEGYIFTFGSVMKDFLIPKISRIGKQSKQKASDLESFAVKMGRVQLCLIALIIVGFISCGQEFCALWMSNNGEYDSNLVYYCVVLICLYQIIYVPENVFNSAMMTDKKGIKTIAILYSIRGAVNAVLAFVLSIYIGVLGACISICVVRFAELIVENIFYHKQLGVSLTSFFSKTYLKFLPAILSSLAVGLLSHFLLPLSGLNTLARFLIIGFSTTIAYGALAWMGFPKETIKLIWLKITNKTGKIVNQPFDETQSRKVFSVAKKGIPFSLAIIATAESIFLVVCGVSKTIGIAGNYVFSYDGREQEIISVSLDNKMTYKRYSESSNSYEETNYYWTLDMDRNDETKENTTQSIWKFVIRINSSRGGSVRQLYYLDDSLYSLTKSAEYGNIQMVFKKQ